MNDDPKSSMEHWLGNYIAEFRATAARNSAENLGLTVSNLDDFSSPCQVHVFWFRLEPTVDFAVLLCTRLKNLSDDMVEVVGPMSPPQIQHTLSEVIHWPRWNANIQDSGFLLPGDGSLPLILAQLLAGAQESFRRYLVERIFSGVSAPTAVTTKSAFPGGGFTWDVLGDLRSLDIKEALSRSFEQARGPVTEPPVRAPEPNVPIRGYGTYFYPPLRFGNVPSPTPDDVLSGRGSRGYMRGLPKALDTTYKGKVLVVNQDGFVGLEAKSAREAMEGLNEIMGTMLLTGVRITAVRESELGQVSIDPASLTIASWSSELVSLRSAQAFGGVGPPVSDHMQLQLDRLGKRVISEQKLMDAIRMAEHLSKTAAARSHLVFLLEAYTYQASSEYRQSVVMSWLVIESWLDWKWSDMLDSKSVSKDRYERLTSPDPWTAELRAETLNLFGLLETATLERLTKIRRRRNRVVHDGYNPTGQEAQEGLILALELSLEGPLKQT